MGGGGCCLGKIKCIQEKYIASLKARSGITNLPLMHLHLRRTSCLSPSSLLPFPRTIAFSCLRSLSLQRTPAHSSPSAALPHEIEKFQRDAAQWLIPLNAHPKFSLFPSLMLTPCSCRWSRDPPHQPPLTHFVPHGF